MSGIIDKITDIGLGLRKVLTLIPKQNVVGSNPITRSKVLTAREYPENALYPSFPIPTRHSRERTSPRTPIRGGNPGVVF